MRKFKYTLNEIPEGKFIEKELDTIYILIYRNNGIVYAFEDRCPHLHVPLKRFGQIRDTSIKCTCHNFIWSLKNGTPINAPDCQSLVVYEAHIIENEVHILLTEQVEC